MLCPVRQHISCQITGREHRFLRLEMSPYKGSFRNRRYVYVYYHSALSMPNMCDFENDKLIRLLNQRQLTRFTLLYQAAYRREEKGLNALTLSLSYQSTFIWRGIHARQCGGEEKPKSKSCTPLEARIIVITAIIRNAWRQMHVKGSLQLFSGVIEA